MKTILVVNLILLIVVLFLVSFILISFLKDIRRLEKKEAEYQRKIKYYVNVLEIRAGITEKYQLGEKNEKR